MWFFVFSINFARTREGRPARRKLTELLVKSKKTLVTEPAAIFFVFQVNISCKTTSIILYFKYASFSVVTRKKRQNTNPHPDGNFFDDLFGLGILRDEEKLEKGLECSFLLSRIILRPFKGIFARAKHHLICSDVVVGNSNDKERNFIPRI